MIEDEPRTGRPLPVGTQELGQPNTAENNVLLKARTLDSSSSAAKSKATRDEEKRDAIPDVIPATTAQNVVKLPSPNKEGAIGTIPLEVLDPKRFKRAPPRERNLMDTSIDTATYQASQQKAEKIAESISEEKPEFLFPWYSVGGFEVSKNSTDQMKISSVVKSYVVENYYTDWYSNTAGVVGTCFFSWLLSYMDFSWWSLGFVFFCTASVYRAELRRFNRNVRDDMTRITVEETLSDRTESSVWLNSFLSKFWTIYMPVLSQQVMDVVNPQLAGAAPGYGIDALSLNEFTLGTKSPAIDAIKSYTKRGNNTVEMDWTFSFTPNDESDMTPKEAKNKINPKIALGVTVGKGFVSKSLPVLVEDINVAGTAHITLQFGDVFPNIKTVSVSMTEPPFIDFALKPVGGDTLGLDIMSFLPGLKTFVKTMINSNVGPMLYAPNQLDIDVEEIMAAQSQDAIGVVAVTIDSASGLKTTDFLSTSVDPYIKFHAEKGIIGNDSDIRTAIKSDTKNPRWNETKYLLVNSLDQKLTLTCFDFNDVRKDATVGSFDIDLSELYQKPAQEHLTKDLLSRGKSKGVLNYSINWFPVIENESPELSKQNSEKESASDEEEDEIDKAEAEKDSDVGIMKFTMHKIKYLNKSAALTGFLSPCAELFVDGKLVKSYRTLRRINEPSWEESIEILVPSRSKSEISIKVYDDQLHGKRLLAEYTAPMEDVLQLFELGQTSVQASPQGEVYITSSWKPVAMTGAFKVSNTVREPLAALRLNLIDASIGSDDLSGVGDIDPYVTVTVNKRLLYRTNYFSETKKPVFRNVIYIPITSENQNMALNLYDYQKVGKDRLIGTYHISSSKLIKRDAKTGRYVSKFSDEKTVQCMLVNKKGRNMKSYMNITCSVVPTIPVYYPHELPTVNQLEERIEKRKQEFEEEQLELKKEMEKHPAQYEIAEVENRFEKDLAKLNKKDKLSLDQLIEHNSGVCSFQILGSSLSPSSAYLQLLYDDVAFPATVTQKANAGKVPPESGNFFIRDLQHSTLTFRIVKKPIVKDVDDVVTDITIPTLTILKESIEEPTTITFNNKANFKIRLLYNPAAIELPSTETIEDTGILDTTFISADDVPSHDRNGKSDPMIFVRIDGEKIYQSATVKKTLNPVWNENTKLPIPSRSRNEITVQVYDWDRAGSNDLLAEAVWNVKDMAPNQEESFNLNLKPQGTIKFRSTFIPRYNRPVVDIAEGGLAGKSLKTVAGLGVDAVSGVAQVGAGVTGAGVGVVTGGLSKGGRLLKGLSGKKSKNGGDAKSSNEDRKSSSSSLSNFGFDPSVPNTSYAPVRPQTAPTVSAKGDSSTQDQNGATHKRSFSAASNFSRTTIPGSHKGKVVIIGTENLGKAVQVRVSMAQGGRMKNLHRTHERKADDNGVCRFDEEVEFRATGAASIVFGAMSLHKFSKDTELGVSQINLSDPQLQQEGQVALRLGSGHIIFKVEYPLNGEIPPTPEIPNDYKQ
ncbi:unnamed protein product [Kluyveromyces dobzhanskii CBS 2104]|uniref:WGS project CCBQ000000000 data, contig 00016 n=1 Tax=Kluyveromyces dobzhanskii CBS 2104 TaxID=1427455 RepID=A0A0A8L066_9SACH|nr:unnamed protein product [Kluyveromyces dobzhanskii CBS 2104]